MPVTTSTNDDVKQAIHAGEAEGFAVWALKQTAGRGRLDRGWESPEGNLYCSALLLPKGSMGLYSFVASLALYDTVKEFAPQAPVSLKWPNDVLVDGKKIAGILLEVEQGWLVIGMGLNVAHYPHNTMYPCTCLKAYKPPKSPPLALDKILDALLGHLGRWHEVIKEQGFAAIRTPWIERMQKGELSVRLPQGDVQGTFAGLDDHGRMRLRLADGTEKAIATGDVFVMS